MTQELAALSRMAVGAVERPEPERVPVRFALGLPHTPWMAERVKSFVRLTTALGLDSWDEQPRSEADILVAYKAFTEKAKAHVWSEALMRWGIEQAEAAGATHLVQLQDDVIPAPNFWPAAAALVAAYPDELLGLETAHPVAPTLASDDDEFVRILTTADGLIGVGWIMPIPLVRKFLEWRRTALREGAIEAITEDTLMGVWCLATGRRVYHPIPTLIDHDLSLESTYGNDAHANRRPTVRWDQAAQFHDAWDARELEAVNFWRGGRKRIRHYAPDGSTFLGMRTAYRNAPPAPGAVVRHVGRFYDVTPNIARQWVKDFDAEAYRRARADDGQHELRRIAILRQARRGTKARERVLVLTPTTGPVQPLFHKGMMALARLFEIDVDNGLELLDTWEWNQDIVRVRSRMLRAALETECTVIHWRDADVAAGGTVVLGMLATGKDFVCTPYPARDGIPWVEMAAAVKAGDVRSLEALSYRYKIGPLPSSRTFDETGCSAVEWMPLGCSILRRSAAEKVLAFYDRIGQEELDLGKVKDTGGVNGAVLRRRIEALCQELEEWRRGHRGLHYVDQVGLEEHPTIGVFNLLCRPSSSTGMHRLYGEDQSFCLRALDAGVQSHMYLGLGSPAAHVGEHVYKGSLESFGMSRQVKAPPRAAKEYALDPPEDPAREPVEPSGP